MGPLQHLNLSLLGSGLGYRCNLEVRGRCLIRAPSGRCLAMVSVSSPRIATNASKYKKIVAFNQVVLVTKMFLLARSKSGQTKRQVVFLPKRKPDFDVRSSHLLLSTNLFAGESTSHHFDSKYITRFMTEETRTLGQWVTLLKQGQARPVCQSQK